MSSKKEGKPNPCPRCGEDYNGILCEKCGYTPYPEDPPSSEEERLIHTSFPKDTVSLPFYIVAVIFIIAILCIGMGMLSAQWAIYWILAGIACLMIGLGRGIRLIYMCLESIWEQSRRRK